MLEKYVTFPGVDERGNALVEALRFGPGLEKTASLKLSELHPNMSGYIGRMTPKTGKLYVLANALGATEFWGANINADGFADEILKNESPNNGYKTFLKAHVFRHHKNKNVKDAFGRVLVTVYNPRMHRVELLLELDRAKARALGHQGLIDELDRGGHPAVSMGMRTPYDICSICGHRSRTDADRCRHIRFEKNKVYPDGRRVYMINPVFRAFDISFVLIGADQTSFAIAKVASVQDGIEHLERAAGPPRHMQADELRAIGHAAARREGFNSSEEALAHLASQQKKVAYAEGAKALGAGAIDTATHPVAGQARNAMPPRIQALPAYKRARAHVQAKKLASAWKLAALKMADIDKQVPAMSTLQAVEKPLPRSLLNSMGRMPLARSLASATSMGIVLKPSEFQRVILVRLGREGMADSLESRNSVFRPCPCGQDRSLGFGTPDRGLMERLIPHLADRGAFAPVLRRRIVVVSGAVPRLSSGGCESTALLSKVAAAYDGYREHVIEEITGLSKKGALQDPKVLATIYPDELIEQLVGVRKTAGAVENTLIFGVLPAMYLLSRAFEKAKGDQQTEGGLKSFARKHPVITGSVLLGLLNTVSG